MSILERNDQSLIITLSKAPELHEPGSEGHNKKITAQKYSVHNSEEWDGNSIHHTLTLEGGEKRESFIDTLAVKNNKIQNLYFHTHRNLSNDSAKFKKRASDKILKIGSYVPIFSTLHTGVFFGGRNLNDRCINFDPRFRRKIFKFQRYSVIFLWTFSSLPSPQHGMIYHFATKPLRINSEQSGEGIAPPHIGLDPAEAADCANYYFEQAHHKSLQFYSTNIDGIPNILREVYFSQAKLGPIPFPITMEPHRGGYISIEFILQPYECP